MNDPIYEVGQSVIAVDVPIHKRPTNPAFKLPDAGTAGRVVRVNASDFEIQWNGREGSDVAFAEEFKAAPDWQARAEAAELTLRALRALVKMPANVNGRIKCADVLILIGD